MKVTVTVEDGSEGSVEPGPQVSSIPAHELGDIKAISLVIPQPSGPPKVVALKDFLPPELSKFLG